MLAAMLMVLSMFSIGIGEGAPADQDTLMIGILHSDVEYPPPAGEAMEIYPEAGLVLSAQSPVQAGADYPENPQSVALITSTSGISYWITMPDDIVDWQGTGNLGVRFSLAEEAEGNDLAISSVQSLEIIGEVAECTIISMQDDTITVSLLNGDGANNTGELELRIDDSTTFVNDPLAGDACQIIYSSDNLALCIIKGQG